MNPAAIVGIVAVSGIMIVLFTLVIGLFRYYSKHPPVPTDWRTYINKVGIKADKTEDDLKELAQNCKKLWEHMDRFMKHEGYQEEDIHCDDHYLIELLTEWERRWGEKTLYGYGAGGRLVNTGEMMALLHETQKVIKHHE